MKPDKVNLPYLIMDIVLKNAEFSKCEEVDGRAPTFILAPTNMFETTNKIRKMIEEVYK